MGMRWVSNPESIKANQPSVLAIAETLAAMGVSVWIAVRWDTYLHIAIGASIAPFLLMRTDESCIRGAEFARKLHKPLELLIMSEIRRRSRLALLLVLLPRMLLYGLWLPTLLLLSRVAAWLASFTCHPLIALVAIPENWQFATVVLDSSKWPDVLPEPRIVPSGFHTGSFFRMGEMMQAIRDTPENFGHAIAWLIYIFMLVLIIVPAFVYRWSLKSTAIIWFPLLWAMRSVREAGKPLRRYLSIYLRDPITMIVLWVSIAAIIGLVAKIALFNEWVGYVEWWNATPLRRVLSLYVTPAEIQWWQLAMVVNSAIAIIMYVLARRWFIRIEHDELTDESLHRQLFQVGLFIRPILSCYTIACTLYITIRAASDWELPALGTRPFPWM